ncbi:MAG: phosphate acyltransferase [Candidatus Fonsibacter ubiquis]|nr:phosphate acyltransferase [Candidatus Fonsibacter ubiquis]
MKFTVAVDAMGGDESPLKVIKGLDLFLQNNQDLKFLIFGNRDLINPIIEKYPLVGTSSTIVHTNEKVSDNESPLEAVKNGKNSSMWLALTALKNKNADIAISAGNTAALLVMSRLILETINGIDKPALASMWPSHKGLSVVLDLGANIDCSIKNLVDFSKLGAALYFSFNGFIEGNHIKDGNVDVIVTDGFSGNIALKTAEGTAKYIAALVKEKFLRSWYSKFIYLLSFKIFNSIKNDLDPRKYNGGIFLGLTSPVVKSHGGTDYIGFYHSIKLCYDILNGNLQEQIQKNL